MHAQKKPKARMEGHLQATRAGQMWVMDILRLEETEEGDHFLFCAIDVFSRYAVVVKLKNANSEETARAYNDNVLAICKPETCITDGGSEFKKVFHEVVEATGAEHRATVPNHSEGHGLVERFNRTFTKTLSQLLRTRKKKAWPDYLGAALVAYNCTPHSSHWKCPMDVFYMTVDHSTMLAQMSSEPLHMRTATELIYVREAMQ